MRIMDRVGRIQPDEIPVLYFSTDKKPKNFTFYDR